MILDNEQIQEYIGSLDHTAKAIKKELLRFCWYMRGGLTYDEAVMLSNDERKIIGEIVKSNIETAKETGQPFF